MKDQSLPQKSGTVTKEQFFSPALGVTKSYYIYLPPGYEESQRRYPALYLFRGHDKEWFDPYQDHTRGGAAIQHLADELLQAGAIGEMILVGVSMASDDGQVFGLGVNFLNPGKARKHKGVGSGRFEDYFTRDLVPHIDAAYRTIPERAGRGADGFSLGGFCSVMLAVKHPRLFSSVGSYDGSFMFRNFDDPRYTLRKKSDRLWVRSDDMFAPAFRSPGQKSYDIDHLLSYNPLNLLEKLSPEARQEVRGIKFYIKAAAYDGYQGNRDRSLHLVTLFQLHGIENHASALILSSDAHHNWKFADLHMRETLQKHSETFGVKPNGKSGAAGDNFLSNLEIISVEGSDPLRRTALIHYRVYQEMPLRIEVFNLHGEGEIVLKNEKHACGHHTLEWEGRNAAEQWVSSGAYYLQFTSPEGSIRQKFVLLR